MNPAGNNDTKKHWSRVKTYLLIAYMLLFIMALLSSLGASFVYIFLGASIFFIYLALQNWWLVSKYNVSTGDYKGDSRQWQWFGGFKTAFKSSESKATLSPEAKQKRLAIMIAVGVVSFAVIFLSVIFSALDAGGDQDEAMYYQSEGDNLYNNGAYDSAYAFYRKVLSTDSENAQAYYSIGNVKDSQEQEDSALYFYEKAIEADPTHVDALYRTGWIYYAREDYPKSLSTLRRLIDLSGDFSAAYVLAGHNYYAREMYDSALVYYEPAYTQGYRSAEFLNILAYIYDTKGQTSDAIKYYEETLSYDSTILNVYQRLGELIPGEDGKYYRMKASGQQW